MLTCLISFLWLCFALIYVFVCFSPCFMLRSASVHAYVLGFMFFHVYVLAFTRSHSCHAYMSRSMFSPTCILGSMLYAIFLVLVRSMPCLCAQAQTCLSCHVLLQPFCSFYSIFLCFGLSVRTRSRPCGLFHYPYTLAHIKGFRSPVFHVQACLLLCFMLVLASLDLGFATFGALNGFVVVWLHSTPMRPCLDAAIRDASP